MPRVASMAAPMLEVDSEGGMKEEEGRAVRVSYVQMNPKCIGVIEATS